MRAPYIHSRMSRHRDILVIKGDVPALKALDILGQLIEKTEQGLIDRGHLKKGELLPRHLFASVYGSGPAR